MSLAAPASHAPQTAPLVGVDFSSSPTRRKPVVLAWGARQGARVVLDRVQCCDDHAGMHAALNAEPAWVGGFDLPFGLPRELVEHLGWPREWEACMDHYCGLTRAEIRDTFAAFTAARPVGAKFAHRACDGPAGSSPSMKWVNPPVAFMLHAGVSVLRGLGAHLVGVQDVGALTARKHAGAAHADVGHAGVEQAGAVPAGVHHPQRVALEAYPGLLARELIGSRSYKSDDRAKQTPERLIARKDLVDTLEQGRTRLGLRVVLRHAQREALVDDASGDTLDALLCLVQAAWAAQQPRWGMPKAVDLLEGWIVSAEA